jgi:spore germination protein PE
MLPRISIVDDINVNSVGVASTLQIGDSEAMVPRSRAFALQREHPIYFGNEGSFSAFPIFSRPIPRPVINENVHMEIINESPVIKVKDVNILSVSAASIVQTGSTKWIDSEARIKHIRHFLSPPEEL